MIWLYVTLGFGYSFVGFCDPTPRFRNTKELKFMHRKSIRITILIIAIVLSAIVFSLYLKITNDSSDVVNVTYLSTSDNSVYLISSDGGQQLLTAIPEATSISGIDDYEPPNKLLVDYAIDHNSSGLSKYFVGNEFYDIPNFAGRIYHDTLYGARIKNGHIQIVRYDYEHNRTDVVIEYIRYNKCAIASSIVTSFGLSKNCDYMFVTSNEDRSILYVINRNGDLIYSKKIAWEYDAAISRDGRYIASWGEDDGQLIVDDIVKHLSKSFYVWRPRSLLDYITKRPTTNGSIHFIGDTGNIAVSYATTPIPERVYMIIEPTSKPYWHRILINKTGHQFDFYDNAYVIGYTKNAQ